MGESLQLLKEKLILAPIIVDPNLSLPIKVMFDKSGLVLGVVLGQRNDKFFHRIYYNSMSLNDAQRNYMAMEQEFLVIVYAFERNPCLFIGYKVYYEYQPCSSLIFDG